MYMGLITLFTAFALSAAAIYFSVVGLVAIFTGAVVPILFMGGTLEIAKLVAASWLYRNWQVASNFMKTYLSISVFILMVITSMGIFGFLSKSHLTQGATSSNNTQQIAIINSQIKSEQDVIERQQEIIKRNSGSGGGSGERIAQLRDKIKQLDREVEAYTSQGSTSTFFNDKVAKGIELKNKQKEERDAIDREIRQLTTSNQGNNAQAEAQISRSQQRIQQLINQRAPLQTAQVKIDAEIGPIKYIGELFVDLGLVDKVNTDIAVRWVIVLIIFVFDPLAVLLLIAAQQSFRQHFADRGAPPAASIPKELPKQPDSGTKPVSSLVTKLKGFSFKKKDLTDSNNSTLSDPVPPAPVQETAKSLRFSELFPNYKAAVPVQEVTVEPTETQIDNDEGEVLLINNEELKTRLEYFKNQKEAVHKWKSEQTNPVNTIKKLRFNYVSGRTNKLPWETEITDIPPMPIEQWNQMIESAEQALEEDQKKKAYIVKEDQTQVRKLTK